MVVRLHYEGAECEIQFGNYTVPPRDPPLTAEELAARRCPRLLQRDGSWAGDTDTSRVDRVFDSLAENKPGGRLARVYFHTRGGLHVDWNGNVTTMFAVAEPDGGAEHIFIRIPDDRIGEYWDWFERGEASFDQVWRQIDYRYSDTFRGE